MRTKMKAKNKLNWHFYIMARRREKKEGEEKKSLLKPNRNFVVYTCGTIRKSTTGHLQHLYRR
jgi:hypothetical protein